MRAYDCPSASDAILQNMGEVGRYLLTAKKWNREWTLYVFLRKHHIDGLVQDCSISSAVEMEDMLHLCS